MKLFSQNRKKGQIFVKNMPYFVNLSIYSLFARVLCQETSRSVTNSPGARKMNGIKSRRRIV